jgi:hypothetical protein
MNNNYYSKYKKYKTKYIKLQNEMSGGNVDKDAIIKSSDQLKKEFLDKIRTELFESFSDNKFNDTFNYETPVFYKDLEELNNFISTYLTNTSISTSTSPEIIKKTIDYFNEIIVEISEMFFFIKEKVQSYKRMNKPLEDFNIKESNCKSCIETLRDIDLKTLAYVIKFEELLSKIKLSETNIFYNIQNGFLTKNQERTRKILYIISLSYDYNAFDSNIMDLTDKIITDNLTLDIANKIFAEYYADLNKNLILYPYIYLDIYKKYK